MKTYQFHSKYSTTTVALTFGVYENGRLAVNIIDAEDGIPYARASVNIPDIEMEDGEFAVRDYYENIGMAEFLKENGIATDTGKRYSSGHITGPIYKLCID